MRISNQTDLNSSLRKFIIVAILATAFGFTLVKAMTLTITHDEAFTYNHSFGQPLNEMFDYSNPYTTVNHHLLNTLAINVSGKIFGVSPFVLRLHSLLAHLLYLYVIKKIIDKFEWHYAVAALALLVLNPFLLEYFILERGYGMAVAFLSFAVYKLINYYQQNKNNATDVLWINISSILSLLSSFIFIVPVFCIISATGILMYRKVGLKRVKPYIPLVISVLFMAYAALQLVFLSKKSELSFGMPSIGASINNVFGTILYQTQPNYIPIPDPIVYALCAFVLVCITYSLVWVVSHQSPPLLISLYTFLSSCGVTLILHWTIGINLPADRTAIALIFLFLLLMAIAIRQLLLNTSSVILFKFGSFIIFAFALGLFLANISFDKIMIETGVNEIYQMEKDIQDIYSYRPSARILIDGMLHQPLNFINPMWQAVLDFQYNENRSALNYDKYDCFILSKDFYYHTVDETRMHAFKKMGVYSIYCRNDFADHFTNN